MNKIIVWFLLIFSMLFVLFPCFGSELYPASAPLYFEAYNDWAQQKFASGTVTPPVASAAEMEIFINTAVPERTKLQIKVQNVWRDIAAGVATQTVDDYVASEALLRLASDSELYSALASESDIRLASDVLLQSVIASETINRIASLTLKAELNGSSTQDFYAGRFYVATGSLALPSISFFGDPDTGFYQTGAGSFRVTVNGSHRMTFGTSIDVIANMSFGTSNRPLINNTAPSGTQPVFSFSGDTLSGIGRFALGQPSAVASGAEVQRWTIDSTYIFKKLFVEGSRIAPPIVGQMATDDNATATIIAATSIYYNIGSYTSGLASTSCTLTVGSITANIATISYTIGADGSGTYRLSFSCSISGGALDEYEFHPFVNGNKLPCAGIARMIGAGGDVGAAAFSGFANLSPGDTVDVRVEQTTSGAQNLTIRMFNFNVERVAVQ